ncbi:MAG: glutamate-1-semialdehyde 2,1-aminomutase [Candidatus Omnitrophota bacterium]
MAKKKIEKRTHTKNRSLFDSAKKYLVGGVNSPVRSFNYVDSDPILIKRGKGSKIYDYDGNRYIDYVLSYGAMILGHAYPRVIKALGKTIKKGLHFGATSSEEIELAKIIQEAIPSIEKIRFVNSGTEAVMSSVRLARAYTKKKRIVKFINAYHGHADYFLVKGGSGLASFNIPLSEGVLDDFIKHTILVDFNNKAAIDKVFKMHGEDIACVIVEPVGGNFGVTIPEKDYLKHVRSLTSKYNALLIFDEVITGFRFSFGSSMDIFGVKPDLFCLGKIIGGGLPIGAYGGRSDIMDNLAPNGSVYQASTFSGNPVVMRSGISTLKELYLLRYRYKDLENMTKKLCEGIKDKAKKNKVELEIIYYKNMFSMKFNEKKKFQAFYKIILEKGVYFAPSEYEANFISFSHTLKDILDTVSLASSALERL